MLVSTRKGPLLLRGVVILAAWLCYYRAARDLQLAELVTIYFAAPLMVTALSVMLLKEQVRWQRWRHRRRLPIGVFTPASPAAT